MYAGDLVIFSETVVGLQTQLNSLDIYCKEWSLKINVHKHNDGKFNWVSEIHKLLTELGFTELWNKQYLDVSFIPLIKQRIFDQEKQIVLGKISDSSKCFFI